MRFSVCRSFGLLLLLACVLCPLPITAQPSQKPNIVLIFADDLGYGDLAVQGHPRFQTPHLDRMAKEGARLTDFYVPTPYCAPSRATLLTGRYPFRNGVMRNPAPDGGINDVGLPASEVTIAEALKPLGYATIAIGKWHLGHTREFLPLTQGFDEYYGILYSNDMRPVQIVHNDKVVEYPVVQANLTRDYTDRALTFIERQKDRPFFLYLPHAMPHKPLAASEDFYTPDTPDDLYADVIRELDWSVGQILKKLKDLGLDEKTLVIFTSDNGPWFGGSTAGLRGMKSISWEGGVRVPMIARWPGKIPAGQVLRQPAATIDIFPTIAGLTGAKLRDQKIDGRNIFPLLSGKSKEEPHPEGIFVMQGDTLRSVRVGDWKYHGRSPGRESRYMKDASKWVDPRSPDGVQILAQAEQPRPDQYPGLLTGDEPKDGMLFNLAKDPAEQHDVSRENPEVVKKLKALFEATDREVPEMAPPPKNRPRGILRLKGGDLDYSREAQPRK